MGVINPYDTWEIQGCGINYVPGLQYLCKGWVVIFELIPG
jgi:hypothetical protein